MRTWVRLGDTRFELDLASPLDLARPVAFDALAARAEQPFGAPAPRAEALRVGRFVGDVGRGGSCNCATITLTPHASGTHTECVGHLTREPLDAWRVLPIGLLPCVLLQVDPAVGRGAVGLGEPARAERPGVITASALEAAWPSTVAFAPLAAVIGSAADPSLADLQAPPYFTADAMRFLVVRGIEHLVVDLPSLDARNDAGALAAHREFFGLPPRSVALDEARRPRATVTELARIPRTVAPGSYLLTLQAPALGGDAVPSRPLLYALAPASESR